jgi:metallo-beta-lactamase family protein
MIRLSFHGAAETVTGSKYLLQAGGANVLIDCGLFQGLKDLRLRNWQPLPFPPSEVDGVVLTHAHIDHVGYLPRFVRDGFKGPVFSTPATENVAELMLLDSAHNQEDDADYANRKQFSKHHPALPLYGAEDVRRTMQRFHTVQRGRWFAAAGPIWARYHDAGHLLGASMIEVEIRVAERPVRILFSGDVGRYDAPLYFDPSTPPACDYLICESTYGDRNHPPINVLDELCEVVKAGIARGGVLLVASFAVGRAQQLIFLLQMLIEQRRIPELPIFLDSPMAVSGMNLYRYYAQEHELSEALADKLQNYQFDLRHVQLARTVAESKQINSCKGPAVIISSSGMMTGGRILHHLRQRLPQAQNTIVLGGYMAAGTRGRALLEHAKTLRMHGQDVPVKAAVVSMSGLSGHAGRDELLRWLSPLEAPRQVFITHGEKPSSVALADELRRTRSWNTVVPKMGETFELAEN